MRELLRTRLAVRSTAVVLAIVGIVGVSLLAITLPLTQRLEEERQHDQLEDLLNTVQHPVSIACFLGDAQLAGEIAEGLLSNRTVGEVIIHAGDKDLARRTRAQDTTSSPPVSPNSPRAHPLTRIVESPFSPGESVGTITLVPDAGAIRANVARSIRFIMLLVLVQVLITGVGVSLVVNRNITRPAAGISRALHGLRAESGEKLAVPTGNEGDELGQLVRDINAMADNMVDVLNQERDLRREHEFESRKFRAIFEHADTGIFLVDAAGMLISANPAFARLFGMPDAAIHSWRTLRFADLCGGHGGAVGDLLARCVEEQRPLTLDLKLGGRPGVPTRWVSVVLSPLKDGRLQGVANDVTVHKQAEIAAQQLAATDRLTGVGNRLGFERQLDDMLERSYRERDYRFTLLMMDLDFFKQVNDTHGHKAGDEVLVQVARRLEQVVRRSDFVGRLGGDEFVVLLDETVDRPVVGKILHKIIAAIDEPVALGDGASATVGVSIGVVAFDDPAVTREELVRRADEAMYAAKRDGRNTFHYFS